MKLLTLLFLSASLWAQTPCRDGGGPLQIGQQRCLSADYLPIILAGNLNAITVLYCDGSCGEYLHEPISLTLTIDEDVTKCAERTGDGTICSFLVIEDASGHGFSWRVGDSGDEWIELFGEVHLVASPIGDRL